MSYKSTGFSQLLQMINKYSFAKQVSKYNGDKNTSILGCYSILVIMMFSQLKKLDSLRDIQTGMNLFTDKFYHLGNLKSVKRSSLSDALKKRPAKVFEDYYYELLQKLDKKGQKKFKKKLNVLDSTTISLCLEKFKWAKFKTTKSGIKLHTFLDYDSGAPVNIIKTNAATHDMKAVKDIVFIKGEIYVFDRAYNDYNFWRNATRSGAVFVTRLKKGTSYEVLTERSVKKGSDIIADQHIKLTGNKSGNYPKKLRVISLYDKEKDKVFKFVTNDLKSKAETIADIYKSRWSVELFFKWIKQHLKIKKFISTSENGVMIQVWTALITYLLLLILKQSKSLKINIFEILRRVSGCLIETVNLYEILTLDFRKKIPRRPKINTQLELPFA